ncbi:MAG TPA: amidohydrolase family protein [Thermoanaerobaculia bacterium]|jgi:imidazolonepropionase-like amidohydrolase
MTLRKLALVALFLLTTTLRADAPGVYALTGATVHPASGSNIPNGIVIIRNGLIEAVGANVTIPADATVIDLKGAHVYPGLIDAQTSMGLAAPARGNGGAGRAAPPPEPGPDTLAARNVTFSDDDLDARRATGVTTIVTAPSHGIFNGQSAVLNLGSGPAESRLIKSPAALQISFNTRPTWTFPDSLMGVMAHIRQSFLDAQQLVAAREVYQRNPSGLQRPAESPQLDALAPVLRRELPVVFMADSEAMMRRAQSLARELNVSYILSGARQGYAMVNDLKNVPVLVSVRWPIAPANKDDRDDQPLRVIRDRQLAPTTPAVLAKSNVPFALVTGAAKAGDFLPGIRKAIENGLSAEDALRATTLWPARIFGVDRQLGSLERGKIANVIVSDKPLFAEKSKVTRVFIDGRELRLTAAEPKEGAAGPIDGTWALSVRAPQGNLSITVTLTAADGRLTGTFSGDRGTGDIRNGTLGSDGTSFEFTISAEAQNEAETTDWVFRGTLTGSNMAGSVTTTIGSWEFSGSKSE